MPVYIDGMHPRPGDREDDGTLQRTACNSPEAVLLQPTTWPDAFMARGREK